MRILLVQLSDIHLRDGRQNAVLERSNAVVDAIKNLDYRAQLCLVMLTGDVAFAGLPEEYSMAGPWLESIKQGLKENLNGNPEVIIVGVPGNHDCRFEPDLPARESLVASVIRGDMAIDDSVISSVTEVQEPFFNFLDGVAGSARAGTKLSYVYNYRLGDVTIAIQGFNTAWLSRKSEQLGTLHFPVDCMPDRRPDADLVISIVHHPYNWLPASGNHRQFRSRLERISDLIFTGHEHVADVRQSISIGGNTLYVEGGALQPDDGDKSEFSAAVIDCEDEKGTIRLYGWDGRRYVQRQSEDWDIVAMRKRAYLSILDEKDAWLNDLDMVFPSPAGGRLDLGDIFVYPDLQEVGKSFEDQPRIMQGEQLAAKIVEERYVLITGTEKAGKTALLKTMFRELLSSGFVPLAINARTDRLRPNRLNDDLESLFVEWYGEEGLEEFRQMDRGRRVLLVDDAHQIHEAKASSAEVLGAMCDAAGHVVLFANELAQALADAAYGGATAAGTAGFHHLHIQHFGHARRHQLVETWCTLDPELTNNPAALAARVLQTKKVLDATTGKSFVPSYPVFLLPLLLAQKEYQPVDLGSSTYGYFFELIIRRALGEGASHSDVDEFMAYLTYLARELYNLGRTTVSDAELRDIHKRFEDDRLAEIHYSKIIRDLSKRAILSDVNGTYEFKYDFIRFYFTARALAETIDRVETQTDIAALCERLEEEEPANILLFLSYLSRHPSILDGIVAQADLIFKEVEEATLAGPTSVREDVKRAYEELEYCEQPAIEGQRKRMHELDEKLRSHGGSPNALIEALSDGDLEDLQVAMVAIQEVIQRFATAVKTLQILGQCVKNSPASLNAEEKLRLVNTAYRLGLRTLGALHLFLEASTDVVVDQTKVAIKSSNPYASQGEIQDAAAISIQRLLRLTTVGMVRRISNAVGFPKLRPVYRRLGEEHQSPSRELIKMALTLDQWNETFPRSEVRRLADDLEASSRLGYEALRHIVYEHFNIFEVDYEDKQAACSRLGISYVRVRQSNPSGRILPRGSQS